MATLRKNGYQIPTKITEQGRYKLFTAMNELTQTLQEIPLAALLPLAGAMVLGFLLWGAGKKVLKTSFSAIGFLIGFIVGWLVGDWLSIGIPAWVAGLVIGVLFAVLAVVLYRTALAVTMAIILAVASPMAVVAAYEWQGQRVFVERDESTNGEQTLTAPEPDEIDLWLEEKRNDFITDEIRKRLPEMDEEIETQLKQIRTHGERLIASVRDVWNSTDPALRPTLIGAAASGAVLGVVLGGLLTGFSAAVVTAFGGSLLWISTMRVILERAGVGDLGFLPTSSRGWLIFWIIAAIIGLGIQWTLTKRSADKSG